MVNKELRKKIAQYSENEGEDIVLLDNPSFDNSIIGISHNNRVVYDYEKMITELSEDDGIDILDAEEFIQYNTIRALPYFENAPIIIAASLAYLKEYE